MADKRTPQQALSHTILPSPLFACCIASNPPWDRSCNSCQHHKSALKNSCRHRQHVLTATTSSTTTWLLLSVANLTALLLLRLCCFFCFHALLIVILSHCPLIFGLVEPKQVCKVRISHIPCCAHKGNSVSPELLILCSKRGRASMHTSDKRILDT